MGFRKKGLILLIKKVIFFLLLLIGISLIVVGVIHNLTEYNEVIENKVNSAEPK